MSGAINGIINLNKNMLNIEYCERLKNKLNNYKLDTIKSVHINNAFMSCGLMHINDEDRFEVLPYYDKSNQLMLTADAIIDNRSELINLLNITKSNEVVTDSQLILMSYIKWGVDCTKYLIGDFAFVIYDFNKNKIFSARDHLGGRTLYYKFINNTFIFSTTIDPIIEEEELNDRWITDFLSAPSVMNQSEGVETVYKDIYQIPAATALIIDNNSITKNKYWDITKSNKTLKLNSDEEYVSQFIDIFYNAVKSKLRTNGEVAIKLSGGLDSSSVAATAAPILKEENKKLYSFTSVPMDNYKKDNNRVVDESKFVKEIKDMYENIEMSLCKSENRDSLKDMPYFLKVFEQPYKTYQNCFWGDEINKRAAEKGCKVILSGQFGNFTISYGNYFTHMKTLLKDKKIITFIKDIKRCSEFHNISYYFTLKTVIKNIIPYKIKRKMRKIKGENLKTDQFQLVNKELINKYNTFNRFEKIGYNICFGKTDNMYDERKFILYEALLAQISIIETKLSLENGILLRDPTKDKRVLEFCFSLPTEQYVRGGKDRYLIRRAMNGLLPDSILSNYSFKGIQSADWLQRLESKKDLLCEKLKLVISDDKCNKYLDIGYLKKQLAILEKEDIKKTNIHSILMAINLYMFLNYKNINMQICV